MWWIYALLSALFAALTAIFAKAGIKGVDTDLAGAAGIGTLHILNNRHWASDVIAGAASAYFPQNFQSLLHNHVI